MTSCRRTTSGRGLRRTALLTLVAFACATARPPAAARPEPGPSPRVVLLEPDIELWMEGTRAIDPAESEQALAATRAALGQALADRGLDAARPDQVLAVHVRGLARTAERKGGQLATVVGIVLVIVAVVVLAVVTSRSRSHPVAAPGRAPLPAAPGPYRGIPPYVAYRPYPYPPAPVGVYFGVGLVVPIGPRPAPWVDPTSAWLSSRGWFDGDEVDVALDLMDARTGEVLWTRNVHAKADPRDPAALTELVDRALEGQPFGSRRPAEETPPAPPDPTPTTPLPPLPAEGARDAG